MSTSVATGDGVASVQCMHALVAAVPLITVVSRDIASFADAGYHFSLRVLLIS